MRYFQFEEGVGDIAASRRYYNCPSAMDSFDLRCVGLQAFDDRTCVHASRCGAGDLVCISNDQGDNPIDFNTSDVSS